MTTTLLGVDDSKTMRKVLEITFAGEDFRTVLAENADDAMSKLHAERPSVVLVDAALDGMSGYDLCQRVKAAAPGVGVLLLSSKQQPYDRNRGTMAGADDFIDKPFDTQQLIDKVVGVLRKGATVSAPVHAQVKPASAPNAAPVPPQAVARPPTVEGVAARPRAQTLAYGSHFTPGGANAPVAPLVPPVSPVAAPQRPPAAAAAAQSQVAPQASVKSGAPAAAQPYAPPQPYAPAVSPAPAPVAAAQSAVAAPAAVAAPPVAQPPIVAPAPVPAPLTAVASSVASHTANGSDLSHKLAGLGLTADQVAGVLALSRDVVEKVVWEVVPTLAETIIKEEIRRLTSD